MDSAKRPAQARPPSAQPAASSGGQVDAFIVIAREMERALAEARGRAAEVETEIARVRAECAEKVRAANIGRAEGEAEREKLRSAAKMLQARAENSRLEAHGYVEEINRLKSQVLEYENRLQGIESKETERVQAIEQFRVMNTRLAGAIERYNELVVKFKDERAAREGAVKHAEQAALRAEQTQARADAHARKTEAEIARLRQELAAAKSEAARARAAASEIERRHRDYAASQEDLQKTIRGDAMRNARAWKEALQAELQRKSQIERELLALRATAASNGSTQSTKKAVQPPPFRHAKNTANA